MCPNCITSLRVSTNQRRPRCVSDEKARSLFCALIGQTGCLINAYCCDAWSRWIEHLAVDLQPLRKRGLFSRLPVMVE